MEKLMQYVWLHRLWDSTPMYTTDQSHSRVKIINQGRLNENAGPDFFNAAIEIDNQKWYGNIELHVHASDWYRHGHDKDKAYDSVILHVVQVDDARVYRSDGQLIPQITVKCSAQAAARCNELMFSSASSLPCSQVIASLPRIYHTEWLTSLGMERLYTKADRVSGLLEFTNGDWESAAYITLARALGFGLNSEPFEILAKNLPLKFLNRHRDDIITMEALIFGQAGMIPEKTPGEDEYVERIREEYRFMAHKFSLKVHPIQWKLSRTRPQNFPYRRLAILAEAVHSGFSLIGRLDDLIYRFHLSRQQSLQKAEIQWPYVREPLEQYPSLPSLDRIRQQFDFRLTGFWATHFSFSATAGATPRAFNRSSIDRLVINVALPLIMARAIARGDDLCISLVPELLRQFPSEDNRDVRLMCSAGMKSDDAFDSQAIIQLRREYCEKNKCIYCRFGHRMLSAEIQR